jgi:hypothetical protein
LIHAAGLLDSIVAYSTHAADFCNTIPLKADIQTDVADRLAVIQAPTTGAANYAL